MRSFAKQIQWLYARIPLDTHLARAMFKIKGSLCVATCNPNFLLQIPLLWLGPNKILHKQHQNIIGIHRLLTYKDAPARELPMMLCIVIKKKL